MGEETCSVPLACVLDYDDWIGNLNCLLLADRSTAADHCGGAVEYSVCMAYGVLRATASRRSVSAQIAVCLRAGVSLRPALCAFDNN